MPKGQDAEEVLRKLEEKAIRLNPKGDVYFVLIAKRIEDKGNLREKGTESLIWMTSIKYLLRNSLYVHVHEDPLHLRNLLYPPLHFLADVVSLFKGEFRGNLHMEFNVKFASYVMCP